MKLMTEMRVGVESMREPRGGRMLRCGLLPVARGRRDGDCRTGGVLAERLTERLPRVRGISTTLRREVSEAFVLPECGSFPLLSCKMGERSSSRCLQLPALELGGDALIAPPSFPPFRGRGLTAAYPGFHPGLSPCRPFGAPEDAGSPLPCLPP